MFIFVYGKDAFYPIRTGQFISSDLVWKIQPVYDVKGEKGDYWRCAPSHKGAELAYYLLTTTNSEDFFCDREEIKKLSLPTNENPHGFTLREKQEEQ